MAPGADALYILGDLFEYWVGDDGMALALPGGAPAGLNSVAAAVPLLKSLSASMPVRFMHGNRDFLVAQRFAATAGVEIISDPTIADLYGTRAVLMHGDTLCTGDVAYQRFRAQVRDPAWQAATLARPLAERVALAEGLRKTSEGAKRDKTMEIMDVAPEAVERAFAECDCDVMIHGHTHRPGRHVHRVAGRERVRWVLNDWYERGGYLEATPGGIRAVASF